MTDDRASRSEGDEAVTDPQGREHLVTLLTRAGCGACEGAKAELLALREEEPFRFEIVDVDEEASSRPGLRAEFGDRLPVVLVDGREHGYWEVDVERLRRDLRK